MTYKTNNELKTITGNDKLYKALKRHQKQRYATYLAKRAIKASTAVIGRTLSESIKQFELELYDYEHKTNLRAEYFKNKREADLQAMRVKHQLIQESRIVGRNGQGRFVAV